MPESELYRQGIELLRNMYGNEVGDLDLPLPENDPAQKEWTAWCYGHMMQERGVIDLQTRALTAISMLTCIGADELIRTWAQGALSLGCNANEIREAIITMQIYAGFPRIKQALMAAQDILKE